MSDTTTCRYCGATARIVTINDEVYVCCPRCGSHRQPEDDRDG